MSLTYTGIVSAFFIASYPVKSPHIYDISEIFDVVRNDAVLASAFEPNMPQFVIHKPLKAFLVERVGVRFVERDNKIERKDSFKFVLNPFGVCI